MQQLQHVSDKYTLKSSIIASYYTLRTVPSGFHSATVSPEFFISALKQSSHLNAPAPDKSAQKSNSGVQISIMPHLAHLHHFWPRNTGESCVKGSSLSPFKLPPQSLCTNLCTSACHFGAHILMPSNGYAFTSAIG